MTSPSLPSFARPPVTEVGLAVQFARQRRLTALDIAAVREFFVDAYPHYEEHPERARMSSDGDQGLSLVMSSEAPGLSAWFKESDDDTGSLIQYQQDRVVFTWRSKPGEEYPRYTAAIRPQFIDAWERLVRALGAIGLDSPRPDTCEVIYLNPIEADGVWSDHGQANRVFSNFSDEATPPAPDTVAFEGRLAEISWQSKYSFPESRGHLLAAANPVRRADTGTPAYMLQLAARLPIDGDGLDGVLAALDQGRKWVVTGFAALTTQTMHEEWSDHDDS